jgi:hypothetical protein
MKHMKMPIVLVLGLFLSLPAAQAWAGAGTGPMVAKKCIKCHSGYKSMNDIVAGDFYSRSNKAKTIQVKTGKAMQLVKFSAQTTVENVPNIKALKKPIPVRVHFKKVGSDLVATKIVAKPKMKVPEDQIMKTGDLAKLVSMGPEKGGYTLVDSRPGVRFKEGHIPSAVSIPFPKMGEMKDRLPKDKDRLLVFYCGGVR